MTIEMYPSDQVADLRAEVTHWYENLQKEQINQQAQLQEFGQSSRKGEFPGKLKSLKFFFFYIILYSNYILVHTVIIIVSFRLVIYKKHSYSEKFISHDYRCWEVQNQYNCIW